jgi:hypothetical protein
MSKENFTSDLRQLTGDRKKLGKKVFRPYPSEDLFAAVTTK